MEHPKTRQFTSMVLVTDIIVNLATGEPETMYSVMVHDHIRGEDRPLDGVIWTHDGSTLDII